MYFFLELFFSFFKLGLFAFGGGYAMVPLLRAELVEKKGWVSEAEIMDYYSIGQCIPGVIAVNVAIFIGYKLKGLVGVVAATLGMVTPSLIIIIGVANVLEDYMDNHYVSSAFMGITIVVVALIFDAIISMWKNGIIDFITFLIFVATIVLTIPYDISPVYIIGGVALFGLLLRNGVR